MQAKRRRISMANISAQPRPEERSLRRSVTKSLPRACRGDAPASANGDTTESFPSTSSGQAFETPRFRAAPQNEVCGRGTRALGYGNWRTLLLTGLSAAAMACAASLAFADPSPILSPEAPLKFGDVAEASPLVAVFAAGNRTGGTALEVSRVRPSPDARPPVRRRAWRETPSPPDSPPQVLYDPTAGPALSPVQSALQAAVRRLVTRGDKRNPLGSGDWRAARGAIAAFYAGRFYAPVWVERKRPDRRGAVGANPT